jgi:hypothetical protein
MVFCMVFGRMLMVLNGLEFMTVGHVRMVRSRMIFTCMVRFVRSMMMVRSSFKVFSSISMVVVFTHDVSNVNVKIDK